MNRYVVLGLLGALVFTAIFMWAVLTAPRPDGDWRLVTVFLLFPGLPLWFRTCDWLERGHKRGEW